MNDVPLTAEQSAWAARAAAVVAILAPWFARQWRSIPKSDFLSVGHEAAVLAARKFDPKGEAKLETFAWTRINGAMQRLAETEQRRKRLLSQRIGHATAENWHEEPTSLAEMMDRPDPTRAETVSGLQGRAAELVAATMGSASHALTGGEDQVVDDIDEQRVLGKLRAAIKTFDRESLAFVQLYYDEGLTVDEVAARLRVVRRTVFRMQERVKAKLVEATAMGGAERG